MGPAEKVMVGAIVSNGIGNSLPLMRLCSAKRSVEALRSGAFVGVRVGTQRKDPLANRLLSRADLFSSSVCRSSSRRMNSRYVICSTTSNGFEMPPDHKVFHICSIRLSIVPVIMLRFLGLAP